MSAKNQAAELAQSANLILMEKDGPLRGACAVGSIEGTPVAAGWGQRDKQSTVIFLVRFKKGSLSVPPEVLKERLATAPEMLQAMDKKKLSGGETKALSVAADGVVLFWDFTFRAPKPDAVLRVLRAAVAIVRAVAAPVGEDCEICGSTRVAELCSVNGSLAAVCSGCRERAGDEDRRAIEAYEAKSSNPAMGTLFGAAAAVAAALLWGGVAYAANRIFLYGAIIIGAAIGFAVHKGMGKINLYGKVLSLVLTLAAVLAGDFFFILLSVGKELAEPLTLDLAGRVADHFVEIEFAEASGYISVLFGLVGAGIAFAIGKKPVSARLFVPVRAR